MIQRIYNALHSHSYRFTGKRPLNTALLQGVVSFSFNDFPVSAITGAKAFEDQGWRGTFYVSPGLYGQHSASGQICSQEDVLSLYVGRHEIGAHTYSHFRCSNLRANWRSLIARNYGTPRGPVRGMLGQTEVVFGWLDRHLHPDLRNSRRLVFVCLGNINRSAFAEAVACGAGATTPPARYPSKPPSPPRENSRSTSTRMPPPTSPTTVAASAISCT